MAEISARELSRRGGMGLLKKYGKDYFKEIGRKGGLKKKANKEEKEREMLSE